MKKKFNISTIVTFTILLILGSAFSILLAGFEIYKNAFIMPEYFSKIEDENNSADSSLLNVIKSVINLKVNFYNNFSMEDFSTSENKKEYFVDSVNQIGGITNTLFYDLAIYHNETYYNFQGNYIALKTNDLERIKEQVNTPVIIDSYEYFNGSETLVIGIYYDDLISIYYLKSELLSDFIRISPDKSWTILVDSNGNPLINKTVSGVKFIDFLSLEDKTSINVKNTNYIVYRTQMSEANINGETFYFYNLLNEQSLFGLINATELAILLSVGIIFIIVLVILLVLVTKLTKPINQLSTNINSIDLNKIGEMEIVDKESKNELDILENNYLKMLKRIQDMLVKQKEDSETQRELELDALQMQINPHFLYNALDTIAWMAKLSKEKNIEEFVIALARFYRLSLHKGDKYISVESEIDIIKYFLEIQLKRFPDLFIYEIEVEEKVKNYKTLKLILQPFVENIIKYAFATGDYKGVIKIKAYEKDDFVVFEVDDNGSGFDTSDIGKRKEGTEGGFGIVNVIERLKLEYEDNYIFEITSHDKKGTNIKISIPKS